MINCRNIAYKLNYSIIAHPKSLFFGFKVETFTVGPTTQLFKNCTPKKTIFLTYGHQKFGKNYAQ